MKFSKKNFNSFMLVVPVRYILIEASQIIESDIVKKFGKRYIGVSEKWDEIAGLLWTLSETGNSEILKTISNIAKDIFNEETGILKELDNVK